MNQLGGKVRDCMGAAYLGSAFFSLLALGRSLASCPEFVRSLCVKDLCSSVCQNCLVSMKLVKR